MGKLLDSVRSEFLEKAAGVKHPVEITERKLDPNLPHRCWLLSFVDGSTREQVTLPPATIVEILKLWPETVAAEPFLGRGDVAPSRSAELFSDMPPPEATNAAKGDFVPFVSYGVGISGPDLASYEALQERAGILHYDAGLPTEEAERQARKMIANQASYCLVGR